MLNASLIEYLSASLKNNLVTTNANSFRVLECFLFFLKILALLIVN